MTMTTAVIPEREPTRLSARTREIEPVDDLLAMLPSPHHAMSWVRGGEGLVGWGEVVRVELAGPDRFEQAERAWRRLGDRLDVDDDVGLPGSGLIAFASFAFGDSANSLLILPRVVIGSRGGRSWITEIAGHGGERRDAVTPVVATSGIRWRDGRLPADRWRDAVAEAVRRMRGGALDKVVLARDLVAEADAPIDPRSVLRRLANRHPDCWTFAVDGLVGATPELLLRRHAGQVYSRVLAGTTWPATGDQDVPNSHAHREEHRLAVESLLDPLIPHCTSVRADGPFALRLRNLTHLSTDVVGTLASPQPGLLRLAEAVHPTAAVGGTPRPEAVRVIAELEGREGMDRGRYAGPVGWMDAAGNGELGIALRCAQLSGHRARLFAGCGLVADSQPDLEVQETHAKFAAMREALVG
jgi:menaquinone-specific isochorismate synthase